jgi:TonB family protein
VLALPAVTLTPRAAFAQDGAAPAKGLVKPVLQKFVEADYPPEAVKDGKQAEVVLEVDIDATGKVTKATVVNPAGSGFDEAAVKAVEQFTFSPALRDGKAIPARIAYRYSFTLKDKAPDPAEEAAAAAAKKRTLLRGTVTIAGTDLPLEAARVTVQSGAGVPIEITTGADGSWQIPDLPAGKVKVIVKSPGFQPLTLDEEITENTATEVVYRLSPEGSGLEVTVRGERPPREVTKRTLERRELSRVPGTNGDALRALQNLPGVARPPGLAGLLIVRGSAPQDTQIFLDGTNIPIAYHFGGLSSVVPTEMLEKLDFYPGNFSTQFGRAMGGIVDIGIRRAKDDGKYHAMAQADLIDARTVAEGPVPFLKNWTFIAGARRSYVDVWLKPVLTQAGAGVTAAPVYYDYQLFVETKPTPTSSFRVGVFGADDKLKLLIPDSIIGSVGLHTTFVRGQALYTNDLTSKTRFKIMGSVGYESINFDLGALYFRLYTYPINNRIELSHKLAKGVTVNIGQDLQWTAARIELRVPQPPRPGEPEAGPFLSRPPRTATEETSLYQPAAYVETEIVPNERSRVVTGFRADYNKPTASWAASPRFNGRYNIFHGYPRTTLKGGIGVFQQPPTPQETSRSFGSTTIRANRAIHYATGIEQEITKKIEISVEGFYKQLDNLVSRSPGANGEFEYANRGSGSVVGGEMLLRYKPDSRFFGWVAYTLSRSVRRTNPDEPLTLFQSDQTHILTMLGSYQLGGGWEYGMRWRLVSGGLDTPCNGGIFSAAAGEYSCISGTAFSSRAPFFSQIDMRVDKRWNFDKWRFSVYLDVQNVTNRSNPEDRSYNYNFTQFNYQSSLPIIPSLGARGEF